MEDVLEWVFGVDAVPRTAGSHLRNSGTVLDFLVVDDGVDSQFAFDVVEHDVLLVGVVVH